METFWEEKHATKNEYWLSGYKGAEILNLHNIDTTISNIKALDIGIGFGYLSKYFHDNHNQVFSCDISTIALEAVKGFATTYQTKELSKIEPVDLAVCHLVFQHCTDDEMERIIREVNLTKTGIFSFQFAFLRDGEPPNSTVQRLQKMGTHHFRSLETVKQMVERSGKKIVSISDPVHYYEPENFSWYFVKLTSMI